MRCLALIEGCEKCDAEADYKKRNGHECGPVTDTRFVNWCQYQGERKRASKERHDAAHEPVRCEDCNTVLWDRMDHDVMVRGLCRSRMCTETRCPNCRAVWSSAGPVDCPSCGSFYVRPDKLVRMRRLYRARRRRW